MRARSEGPQRGILPRKGIYPGPSEEEGAPGGERSGNKAAQARKKLEFAWEART